MAHAFWLDEDFDREHAPDGPSRYAAEVRRRMGEFSDAWGDIAPVTFAVTAWRVGQYVAPSERDLTRDPHLRASLLVQAPVPLDGLPPAPEGPHAEVEQTARRAVTVVVRELDDLVTPLVDQLETGVPPCGARG